VSPLHAYLDFPVICILTSLFLTYIKLPFLLFFFFFNDTATTEIYTLSLHDALPILILSLSEDHFIDFVDGAMRLHDEPRIGSKRSEEHTSELQSRENLVCRLLLEKKKKE